MSNKKTLNEMLAGAKRPTELVQVCFRADVLAEINKLELQIRDTVEADVESSRLAGGEGPTAADLADQIRELEAIADENTLDLVVQGLTGDRWEAAVAARTENGQWNVNLTLKDILQESIIEPPMTTDQVQNMLKVITDGQWAKIGEGLLSVNKHMVSVPKSLTASAYLTDRSGKPESDKE